MFKAASENVSQAKVKKKPMEGLFHMLGSLSNYDDDDNDDFKKAIGLMVKTTALHVYHAF